MAAFKLANVFKSKNILEVMHGVLFFARIGASMPFNFIVKRGKSKTVLSYPYFLWSLMIQASYFTCAIIVTLTRDSHIDPTKRSGLNVFREQLEICSGFASVLFLVVDTFVNKDDLAKAFEHFFEVDAMFESIGRRRYYYRLRFRLTVFIVAFYIVHSVSSHLGERLKEKINNSSLMTLAMAVHFPTYMIAIVLALFVSFVYMISLDLLILNREIEKICFTKEPKMIIYYNTTTDAAGAWEKQSSGSRKNVKNSVVLEKISLLWQAYTKICHISLLINHYFSRKIMVIIALSFLSALFNLFFFLTELIHLLRQSSTDMPFLIYFASKCLVHVINLVIIISSCDACEELVSQIDLHLRILIAYFT